MSRDISHAIVTKWGDVYLDDWPDCCDAYAAEAKWEDGTFLSEEELEELNDDSMILREKLEAHLF